MAVSYARIQEYLDKILAKDTTGSIDESPHKVFWKVDRDTFVKQSVPHVSCNGKPMPVVKVGDSANSPLYLVLISDGASGAACKKPQMPAGDPGGPFITDPGYQITLGDNTTVTGSQIQQDVKDWIDSGCPE